MEKYIRCLLFDYECVIVPGLGGFLTHYISADIHPITHKFTPPSKRVAFNEQLQQDDGLLVQVICKEKNISREAALSEIEEFVKKFKDTLHSRKFFELPEIGGFFYNKDNKLEFEPDTSVNYLDESYALPELIFKPIERKLKNMNQPIKAGKPPVKKPANKETTGDEKPRSNAPLIVILILLLIGTATTFLYFNQDNESLASINPFVIFKSKEVKEPEPPKAKVDSVPQVDTTSFVAETVDHSQEIISSETGRYFIVIASFKNQENAMKYREKLESENVNATVISPSGRKKFYRVSVADFDTKDAARAKLSEYEATYGKAAWVLTY